VSEAVRGGHRRVSSPTNSSTLSTIGNLSDRTFVSRLDTSVLVLTYLTVEAFVAGHYGHKVGEFRFGAGSGSSPLNPIVLDFGLALRVNP
jgi:hypothetical protein